MGRLMVNQYTQSTGVVPCPTFPIATPGSEVMEKGEEGGHGFPESAAARRARLSFGQVSLDL